MDGFDTVFSSSRSLEEEEEADNSSDRAFADGYATSGERALTDNKRHRGHFDSDRRNRREIANSNERKRMQSINAGFQSLRSIVCPKTGEKLSKAAILKYAAEFINVLMHDKQQLIADKRCLEQVLTGAEPNHRCHSSVSSRLSPTSSSLPARKRWRDAESSSSDEGIGFASTDEVITTSSSSSGSGSKAIIGELRRQVDYLKQQLEKERKLRLNVEMDRERLERSQQQQPTPPLSYQRTMSSSSSSSFSSSASDTSSLDLALPPPTTTTTTTCSSSKDLQHNTMWRRNLETIVEAIRHVEGDSGLFASPEPTQPERHAAAVQPERLGATTQPERHGATARPEPPRPEAMRVTAPWTEQVHSVWLSDLTAQTFPSTPDTMGILHPFHRPSLTVPSS